MADDKEIKTETTAPAQAATEAKPNGAAKPAEKYSPRLSRFERYFSRPVALQIKHHVLHFQCSGDYVEVHGERFATMDVMAQRSPNGEVAMHMLPFLLGILNASTDGEYLILWVTMPDGSIIEYNLDPEAVATIGFAARTPSAAGRIIQPGMS